MKHQTWLCLMGVALMVSGDLARAGPVEAACDRAYRALDNVPHTSLTSAAGPFTDDGRAYDGCIVRLEGARDRVGDTEYPVPLLYPSAGSGLYDEGWRADAEADGPDGTSFRISRENVFCRVVGIWDGGDDSDPDYVPSTRYEVIVACGQRAP